MAEKTTRRNPTEITLRELLDVPEPPLKRGDEVYVCWLEDLEFTALACTVTRNDGGKRVRLRHTPADDQTSASSGRQRKLRRVVMQRYFDATLRVVEAKGKRTPYGRVAVVLPRNAESRDRMNSVWATLGAVKRAAGAVRDIAGRLRAPPLFATNELMNSSEARMFRITAAAKELRVAVEALLDEEQGEST